MDPYSTHLEPLVKAAIESNGDILELGCGDYSTPLLASIALNRGKKLYVKSSDARWANQYKDICDVEIVNWDTWKIDRKYGMIFLDNEEHAPQRTFRLASLKDYADVIVMHDASQAMDVGLKDILHLFKSYKYYDKHDPATVTVVC